MKVTNKNTADGKKTEPPCYFLDSDDEEDVIDILDDAADGIHEASSSGILDPTRGRIPTRPMPLPKRKAEFDFSAKFSGSFLAVRPILEKASVEQIRAFEKANRGLKKMCTPLWERFCGKKVFPTSNETWRDVCEKSLREAEARGQAFLEKYRERQVALAEAKKTLQPRGPKELPAVPVVVPHKLYKKAQKKLENRRFWFNSEPEEKTYLHGVQRGFLMKKVKRTLKNR